MKVSSLQLKTLSVVLRGQNLHDTLQLCDDLPHQCFGSVENFETVIRNVMIPGLDIDDFILCRRDFVTPQLRRNALLALSGGFKTKVKIYFYTKLSYLQTQDKLLGTEYSDIKVVTDPIPTLESTFMCVFAPTLKSLHPKAWSSTGLLCADLNQFENGDSSMFETWISYGFENLRELVLDDVVFDISGFDRTGLLESQTKITSLKAVGEFCRKFFIAGSTNVLVSCNQKGVIEKLTLSRVTRIEPVNLFIKPKKVYTGVVDLDDTTQIEHLDGVFRLRQSMTEEEVYSYNSGLIAGFLYQCCLNSDGTCTTVGRATDSHQIIMIPGLLPSEGQSVLLLSFKLLDSNFRTKYRGESIFIVDEQDISKAILQAHIKIYAFENNGGVSWKGTKVFSDVLLSTIWSQFEVKVDGKSNKVDTDLNRRFDYMNKTFLDLLSTHVKLEPKHPVQIILKADKNDTIFDIVKTDLTIERFIFN